MGGGADGEDPGSPPPPEDVCHAGDTPDGCDLLHMKRAAKLGRAIATMTGIGPDAGEPSAPVPED